MNEEDSIETHKLEEVITEPVKKNSWKVPNKWENGFHLLIGNNEDQ